MDLPLLLPLFVSSQFIFTMETDILLKNLPAQLSLFRIFVFKSSVTTFIDGFSHPSRGFGGGVVEGGR